MRSGDVAVGRRVFLGLLGLGGAGIVFGAKVQRVLGDAIGSGLEVKAGPPDDLS
jgi:hypothetical protein